uniref:Uncharacterized protein n=1 Tax=Anopheles atroparvus TaxID=41427 RepID=A0A182IT05_ANOAO
MTKETQAGYSDSRNVMWIVVFIRMIMVFMVFFFVNMDWYVDWDLDGGLGTSTLYGLSTGTLTSYGTFFSTTTGYGLGTSTGYGLGTSTLYGLSTGTFTSYGTFLITVYGLGTGTSYFTSYGTFFSTGTGTCTFTSYGTFFSTVYGWGTCTFTSYGLSTGYFTSYGTFFSTGCGIGTFTSYGTFFSTVYGTCFSTVYGTGTFFSIVTVLMCSWWCSSCPPKSWPKSPKLECRPRFSTFCDSFASTWVSSAFVSCAVPSHVTTFIDFYKPPPVSTNSHRFSFCTDHSLKRSSKSSAVNVARISAL